MAILKKIYPLLVLPFLTGCEEVFTPDMPHLPVLCVNSLITEGEPIKVSVSRSRLYTDTLSSATVVDDADVRIYANGHLQLDSYIPKENDEIKIAVHSPSLGYASADVTVPCASKIQKLEWQLSNITIRSHVWGGVLDNNWRHDIWFKLNIRLTIADIPGDNYYRFTYRHGVNGEESGNDDGWSKPKEYGLSVSGLQYNLEPIFGEHIGVFDSMIGADSDGFTFFTDAQFSENTYTLNLQFDYCNYYCLCHANLIPEGKLVLNLSSVSPSYYNWTTYVWQRDNGTLSELGDYGLGEPIWGYSNVTSGAGVVAAQTQYICTIDLTDYIRDLITNQNEQH